MENQRFTVLLVEDDLNDIFLVKRAFRTARIPNPLQIVTDGEEAMSYLRGEGKYADREAHPLPKLMVMDIKMPRRSGFEVLEWVKSSAGPLRRDSDRHRFFFRQPVRHQSRLRIGRECLHDQTDELSVGRAFVRIDHAVLGFGMR